MVALLLPSTGSRHEGCTGLVDPETNGVFLDHGSDLCPLHWQVDPLPQDYQGSLAFFFKLFLRYMLVGRTYFSSCPLLYPTTKGHEYLPLR